MPETFGQLLYVKSLEIMIPMITANKKAKQIRNKQLLLDQSEN